MAGEIVYERLIAEAEAWPFLSQRGFQRGSVVLGRVAPGVLDPATSAMARELEEHLRLRARGLSLEVLNGVRDHAWFGAGGPGDGTGGPNVSLEAYLYRLASFYLEPAGASVRLREAAHPSRTDAVALIALWRWISLLLPPDLMISSLYSLGGQEPPANRVSLVSPQLAQVLNEPVAETHLHEKAAFSFSQLWTSWMGWFLREGPRPGRTPPAPDEAWPFGGQTTFFSLLLAAAITRTLMAGYLLRLEAGRGQSFAAFCREAIERAISRHGHPVGQVERQHWCGAALRMLLKGSGGPGLAELGHVYRLLVGRYDHPRPGSLEQIYAADPIAPWMPGVPGKLLPETLFATRAQRAIRSGLADADFQRFFWQYQRVRCRAYAFLVLESGTAGLDWFQRFFGRLKALRGDLDSTLLDAALEHESADLRLGALELRRTPPETWIQVCGDVQKLVEGSLRFHRRHDAGADFRPPEIGLTYHFLKERINARHPERRLHADPEGNGTGVRFGDWFAEQRRRAQALAGALERFPSMLLFIRGLDFASTELSVPSWPTLGILAETRRASVHASRVLASRETIPPLRVTYHVGEDFRRLVEGLRRIHELVEFGALQQGDRIGHGVALGVDVGAWARHARMIHQPAEERIDDLLWELERYQRGNLDGGTARRERVRAELRRLLRDVYLDPTPDLDMYLEARRLRHSPAIVERMGYPRRVAPGSDSRHPSDAFEVLRRYLTSTVWFRRGEQPLDVRLDDSEMAMLTEAQRWLRRLLGRMEVTVESNPSSNLLTSDMGVLGEHPALRLTQGPSGDTPLLVSINTDDPITFATRLSDEYAYLYFTLLQNHTAQEALAWVERVRLAGWRSRFTLPASADGQLLQRLAARWRSVL
ncbi:hypothetical protein JRI60_52700 [Archangium violaceum]|uniref:hypothetical protein n=1 Tax=Archangium violaceum TaxID=83451 RepID=UPI001950555C|nr:hypothetical protein [Archangium violaceum]QRN97495.1 hypothetical protein JRI60_52700 [Archangium violaceum]